MASGLSRSDDDLILNVAGNVNQVKVVNFFSVANTVEVLEFEVGGQITNAQLYGAFGVSAPTAPTATGIVSNVVLGGGTGAYEIKSDTDQIEYDFNHMLFNNPPSRGAIEGNPFIPTSVSEVELKSAVNVFPNPTSGTLSIEISEPEITSQTIQFVVFDLLGKEQFTHKLFLTNKSTTVLPDELSGSYLWVLYSDYKKLANGFIMVN